jgi:hypothetical protein
MTAPTRISPVFVPSAQPPYRRLGSLVRYAGAIVAAAAFTGTIAFANVPTSVQPVQGSMEEMTAAAPTGAKANRRARCETCGVIQTIRRVDATDGHAPTYEITIRLRDGSTRTNSNATPGNWRAGDRIMLINGGHAATAPTT